MPADLNELILCRELAADLPPTVWPVGFEGVTVQTTQDSGFPALRNLYESYQFPAGWVEEMLSRGRAAVVALATDQSRGDRVAAGGGWSVREPFHVDELGRKLDCGGNGVYFFGDLVASPWRGRGLQRLVIHERSHLAARNGVTRAFSVTHRSNIPSLKSYQHEEFSIALEIAARFFWKFRIDKMIWNSSTLLKKARSGLLSPLGIGLPLGYRLRRRGRL